MAEARVEKSDHRESRDLLDRGSSRDLELTLPGTERGGTLDAIRQISSENKRLQVPEQFGTVTLLFDRDSSSPAPVLGDRQEQATAKQQLVEMGSDAAPTAEANSERRTRIKGTGASSDTNVRIQYDADGKPFAVRDHLGEWNSTDGGTTWKTGEPNFRVRRGEVSIDSKGVYTFNNDDYGVQSKFLPDGTSSRQIKTPSGETYSVQRNQQGVPISFSAPSGNWRGDGANWINETTGEKRAGRVNLTEHGEFRFESKTEKTIVQSPQLERIKSLESELSQKYGIKFGKAGEQIPDGEGAINGVPTEAELKVLDDVVKKTNHENYQGMKIWFVRPNENKENYFGYYGNESNNGKGSHSCSGGCAHSNGTARTAGGDMVVLPKARQEPRGTEGLEGTLLHEFVHHEQGQRYGHQTQWGGRNSTPEARELAGRLGWVYNPALKEHLLLDQNGGQWRYDENKDNWFKHRGANTSERLTNQQMKERALIKPISDYFPYPYEHHAEGLAMFRMGVGEDPKAGDRRTLAQTSPELYKIIKQHDQEAIDRKHGGDSKEIRDLNGHLIPNTENNRRRILEAERAWGL